MADVPLTASLRSVPAIPAHPEQIRFSILVWPYKTNVLRDFELYQKLGISGFQIDRGAGQEKKVDFSIKQNFPYYVGHAADKGFLHLTRDNRKAVMNQHGLVIRPHSLADPRTLTKLKEHLLRNVTATRKGRVLAYAFDDEISLGSMANPCDVDIHPLSLQRFRKWLKKAYGSIEQLNRQWNTSFAKFDEIMPQGFEQVRTNANKPPLACWNLSPWMDFRHFMDFQFSSALSELVQYTNSLAPNIPAGFVGGQGPSPWGGYDYAMLSRAVQWMEAYDIHGTNEILRSWWNAQQRLRMQTFFSTKNPKVDSWFLWYYMVHGNHAVIAWPDGWFHTKSHDIAPHILANKQTFEEIQGEISKHIVNSETLFDPDPVGIYYSHPSIQAGWAMDAIVHGKTWVKRSGTLDDENQSAGVLRKVWCKTLEDLGFQYDFVSYLDVEEGQADLKAFKVIILPKTICLSDKETDALTQFVQNGGVLIADYLCGILDEHGKGRSKGALDDLFGLVRDESAGYLNGKGLTEIDGEKYQASFLDRFTCHKGARRHKGMVVFERGTRDHQGRNVCIEKTRGKGKAIYLNLSPLEYWDPARRFSDNGYKWRKIISDILKSSDLVPRVKVYENENPVNMIESLWWKNGDTQYLCIVKNPTEKKELRKMGNGIEGITGEPAKIRLAFPKTVALVNLRTTKHLGKGQVFYDHFSPWQANVYEVRSGK